MASEPLEHIIESEDVPTCPFCLEEDETMIDAIPLEGEAEVQCQACLRLFVVRSSITVRTFASLVRQSECEERPDAV